MIIKKVALKNIKSYSKAETTFGEGITGIAGLNGAGKSTLLEAIGYALFDAAAYNQADFVRKGEKTGEISVTFEGSDGIEYTIIRKCGSTQSYALYDGIGNKIEGKDEVGKKLCQVLGYRVTDTGQLKSLFENAVGVLQGTFATEFLSTAGTRKKIFDPLLRIDEYDSAYKGLLPLKNLVSDRIKALVNDISWHEGKASSLDSLKAQHVTLTDEINTGTLELDSKRISLIDVKSKKELLDAQEGDIKNIENELKVIKAEAEGKSREFERAKSRLSECEAAEKVVADCVESHNEYISKAAEKEKLERRREERDGYRKKSADNDTLIAGVKVQISGLDKRLIEIGGYEKDLVSLSDAVKAQEVLEQRRDSLRSSLHAKDMELKGVLKNKEKVKDSKGNVCPIFSVECKTVSDFSLYFESTLSGIDSEKKKIQEDLSSVEGEIKKLGDPRTIKAIKADFINRKPETLKEKNAAMEKLLALEEKKALFEDKLKEFASLDDDIKAAAEAQRRLKPANDLYLQNIKTASLKAEYAVQKERAGAALASSVEKASNLAIQLQDKKGAYDALKHDEIKSSYEKLNGDILSLDARLEEKRKRVSAINSEMDLVLASIAKISGLKDQKAKEERYMAFVDWMRETIKKAGPEVARVYIDLISRESTKIYCEISGDSQVRLKWTDDFDILLIEDGRERTFRQLSGGEQMSAALAVRLAILRILTGSDIVFLDEPTQNMDERRRQNLAEQILRIKDFRQVFVISHDDTFSSNLENVIEVEKVNGESLIRRRA